MNALNFSELHRSLLEIQFELIHANNTSTKDIVDLNLFASSRMCVYSQSLWTGKVVELWTKVWTWLPGNASPCKPKVALDFIFSTVFQNAVNSTYECRRNRMIHCIQSINNAFNLSKEQINLQENRYRIDLQEELPSIDKAHIEVLMEDYYSSEAILNENDLIAMRHTILRFHQATMKFWRFYMSRKVGLDQRKLLYNPILQHLLPDSHFFNRSFYKALIYEGRWVVLESKLQQAIPFVELAKLNHPHLLKEKDKTCLKKWIEKINVCHETIPSKLFLSVIIEVAKLLKIQGSTSQPLFNLVFWLKKEKCIFVKKNDPHQLRRRATNLKSGKTIQCNHKNYTLGKYLGEKRTHLDKYHYYELENTNYVIEVPNNGFRSFLRTPQEKNYSFHWGTKLLKTIDIDPKGRFVILEKLPFSLSNHIWTSSQ
ncbi:MAG: hypothetical protein Q8K60_07995, partial [Parachlamydiaceae bacterium]|nr:hypothetical protein [Parachlamydiaceae bacterium]